MPSTYEDLFERCRNLEADIKAINADHDKFVEHAVNMINYALNREISSLHEYLANYDLGTLDVTLRSSQDSETDMDMNVPW